MDNYKVKAVRPDTSTEDGKSMKKIEPLRRYSSMHRTTIRSLNRSEREAEFDPSAMFSSIVEELSPEAEDRGIEMLVNPGIVPPLSLTGDPGELREALGQLVRGELSVRKDGWICLGLACIPDSVAGNTVIVRFSIQSAGLDMPPKDISVALNPSGVPRRIAWAPGGALFLESDGGGWSHVFFDLKLRRSEQSRSGTASEAGETAAARECVKPFNALLIQEATFIRDGLQRMLEGLGGTVVALAPSEVDVPRSGGDRFDVIVLDAAIREDAAEDFLLRLRMEPRFEIYRSVPVIVLTAHARDEGIRDLFPYGADDFVFKPVNPANLKNAIDRIPKNRLDAGTGTGDLRSAHPRKFVPAEIAEVRLLFSSHPDLLKEITSLFQAEACRHLLELKRAIRAADYFGMAYTAGCLISDTAVVGLCGATDHLRAIVEASRREDLERIRALYRFVPGDVLRIAWILRKASGEYLG